MLVSSPASPVIGAVVAEMRRVGIDTEPEDIVALLRRGTSPSVQGVAPPPTEAIAPSAPTTGSPRAHYIFPVGGEAGFSAEKHLEAWLRAGFWGVRQSTAHRTRIKGGDECCFYVKKVGVVTHARVTGQAAEVVTPAEWPGPDKHSENVFKIPLSDVQLLSAPVLIDSECCLGCQRGPGRSHRGHLRAACA